MSDQDRAAVWDRQKVADALFSDKGGMAVWIDRREASPRACVRAAGDLTQTCMDLAALQVGLDRLIAAMAKAEGVGLSRLHDMISTTKALK